MIFTVWFYHWFARNFESSKHFANKFSSKLNFSGKISIKICWSKYSLFLRNPIRKQKILVNLPEKRLIQVSMPNSALSTFIPANAPQKLNIAGTKLSRPAKHSVFRVYALPSAMMTVSDSGSYWRAVRNIKFSQAVPCNDKKKLRYVAKACYDGETGEFRCQEKLASAKKNSQINNLMF